MRVTDHVIARQVIPDDTIIMYEFFAAEGLDRSENWRFLITKDGGFYNARNERLWITDPQQLTKDDPELFWNTPFPAEPQRRFTEAQVEELTAETDRHQFRELAEQSPIQADRIPSNPFVERWTILSGGRYVTVIVENGATPDTLLALRQRIDRFVERQAPRRRG